MAATLVTGSSGFIGAAAAGYLARAGETVIGLDPAPPRSTDGGIVAVQDRIGPVDALCALMARHDVTKIVHAGGLSGPMLAKDAPHDMCEANIVATINLVEAARRAGVRRFVYCSSASVFGHTPQAPVPDDTPLRPTNLYGATKGACDLVVAAYRDGHGLDAISLRLSNVFGPGRRTDCAIRTMLTDAMAGRRTRFDWGIGCFRPYLFVDDAVAAIAGALRCAPTRQYAYNIAGPDYVEMTRVGEIVKALVPEADIGFGDGPDPLGYRREALDIRAAARDLGFHPQFGIECGVQDYLQWLRVETSLPHLAQ